MGNLRQTWSDTIASLCAMIVLIAIIFAFFHYPASSVTGLFTISIIAGLVIFSAEKSNARLMSLLYLFIWFVSMHGIIRQTYPTASKSSIFFFFVCGACTILTVSGTIATIYQLQGKRSV